VTRKVTSVSPDAAAGKNRAAHVKLVGMTEAEAAGFLETVLPPYIAERAAADHVSSDEAERVARALHAQLLPGGKAGPGHTIAWIVAEDQPVGGLWFYLDTSNREAYVYNITVFPQHRRRGFARGALTLVEQAARDAGCRTLALNVFAPNKGAIALYRKLGFSAVSMHMNKAL
jgi:ribosomal protein S18 acetylase RimI-like enzyme